MKILQSAQAFRRKNSSQVFFNFAREKILSVITVFPLSCPIPVFSLHEKSICQSMFIFYFP